MPEINADTPMLMVVLLVVYILAQTLWHIARTGVLRIKNGKNGNPGNSATVIRSLEKIMAEEFKTLRKVQYEEGSKTRAVIRTGFEKLGDESDKLKMIAIEIKTKTESLENKVNSLN